MFGFERGAFTDARRSKPGLLQAAHRGTIFLDEVGLLPEALQAKLLKVLEDRVVRRLGATRDEAVDVWIVTATNEDLATAVQQRRFREDLYHRLAVLTVALPPLRERAGDVLQLAEHFLTRTCADYGVPRKTLSADARAALVAYRWPGNVRELSNVLERAVLMSAAGEITAEGLGLPAAQAPIAAPPPTARTATAPVSLNDAMREHLLEVLTQTSWNISRTAALLGISRNTLRARMDKYGLREGAPVPAPPPTPRARVSVSPPPVTAPTAPAPVHPTPAAGVAPSPVPPPTSARRWERRRVALLRAALVPAGGPDAQLETGRTLELVLDKIRSFGGRVEGLGPIGAVAVFGLTEVGDAADRAGHGAMAIVKAVERTQREDGAETAVKVGIHVGVVLVGVGPGPGLGRARHGRAARCLADARRARGARVAGQHPGDGHGRLAAHAALRADAQPRAARQGARPRVDRAGADRPRPGRAPGAVRGSPPGAGLAAEPPGARRQRPRAGRRHRRRRRHRQVEAGLRVPSERRRAGGGLSARALPRLGRGGSVPAGARDPARQLRHRGDRHHRGRGGQAGGRHAGHEHGGRGARRARAVSRHEDRGRAARRGRPAGVQGPDVRGAPSAHDPPQPTGPARRAARGRALDRSRVRGVLHLAGRRPGRHAHHPGVHVSRGLSPARGSTSPSPRRWRCSRWGGRTASVWPGRRRARRRSMPRSSRPSPPRPRATRSSSRSWCARFASRVARAPPRCRPRSRRCCAAASTAWSPWISGCCSTPPSSAVRSRCRCSRPSSTCPPMRYGPGSGDSRARSSSTSCRADSSSSTASSTPSRTRWCTRASRRRRGARCTPGSWRSSSARRRSRGARSSNASRTTPTTGGCGTRPSGICGKRAPTPPRAARIARRWRTTSRRWPRSPTCRPSTRPRPSISASTCGPRSCRSASTGGSSTSCGRRR